MALKPNIDGAQKTKYSVGEADGAVKYDDRQVLYKEKVREDRIRAKGLRCVRWGWDDMTLRIDRVADQIWRAARMSA